MPKNEMALSGVNINEKSRVDGGIDSQPNGY
jgi:hypothetical protein